METEDPALRPVRALVEEHLALPGSTWAMGAPGALGGFLRGEDEPTQRGPNSVVTGRGGIRVALPDDAVAVAYEAPSARDPLSWHQAVAFCVPMQPGPARTTVTELGPDTDALRPQDTRSVLFDLGLGAPAWDLARPAAWYACGLLPPGVWQRFLAAYRAAGGPAVPADGDPWAALDAPARALTAQTAARSVTKAVAEGRPLDDVEEEFVGACARMAAVPLAPSGS